MRIEKTINVPPGSTLGRTIYRPDGLPLLTRGTVLTQKLITRLAAEDVLMLYIEDPLYAGIEPTSPVRDVTLLKGSQIIHEVFDVLKTASQFKNPKEANLTYIYNSDLIESLQTLIDDILSDIQTNPEALYQIINMSSVDQYTYRHSVDVAILAILIGQEMGYDYKTTKLLGMGGLLHDIGKAHISTELLNKKSTLDDNEWQEMKQHAIYGYNAVRDLLSINGHVKQMILYHHERLDGSGYPYGLKGNEINMLTRIISVSDIFNALGSHRIYREAMSADKILDILYSDAVYKLDRNVIQALVRVVHIYPEGTLIRLSDGRQGIVVESRKVAPTRPLVKIVQDDSLVDLMRALTLFVDLVL